MGVAADDDEWSITDELSAFDSDSHSYIFWINDASGASNMVVGDCSKSGPVAIKLLPISWDIDAVDSLAWDSASKNSLVAYNSTSSEFIRIDILSGTPAPITSVVSV